MYYVITKGGGGQKMAIFDYVQKTPNLDYVIHGCSLSKAFDIT